MRFICSHYYTLILQTNLFPPSALETKTPFYTLTCRNMLNCQSGQYIGQMIEWELRERITT